MDTPDRPLAPPASRAEVRTSPSSPPPSSSSAPDTGGGCSAWFPAPVPFFSETGQSRGLSRAPSCRGKAPGFASSFQNQPRVEFSQSTAARSRLRRPVPLLPAALASSLISARGSESRFLSGGAGSSAGPTVLRRLAGVLRRLPRRRIRAPVPRVPGPVAAAPCSAPQVPSTHSRIGVQLFFFFFFLPVQSLPGTIPRRLSGPRRWTRRALRSRSVHRSARRCLVLATRAEHAQRGAG